MARSQRWGAFVYTSPLGGTDHLGNIGESSTQPWPQPQVASMPGIRVQLRQQGSWMNSNLKTTIVLKQRVLHGSSQPELLQRVATVYINGREYRVSAPPEARGDALDWVPHFRVRQLVDLNSEVEIQDDVGALALKVVKEELENQKRDARRAQEMHPDHRSEVPPAFRSQPSARPARAYSDPIPASLEEIDRDIDYWTGRLGEGEPGSNHEYWVNTRLVKLRHARTRLPEKGREQPGTAAIVGSKLPSLGRVTISSVSTAAQQ